MGGNEEREGYDYKTTTGGRLYINDTYFKKRKQEGSVDRTVLHLDYGGQYTNLHM